MADEFTIDGQWVDAEWQAAAAVRAPSRTKAQQRLIEQYPSPRRHPYSTIAVYEDLPPDAEFPTGHRRWYPSEEARAAAGGKQGGQQGRQTEVTSQQTVPEQAAAGQPVSERTAPRQAGLDKQTRDEAAAAGVEAGVGVKPSGAGSTGDAA